jgi:hypothetical protein
VPYVVGPRTSINVVIDWTEFDADGQATLMLSMLTRHGRATPLLWLTVDTATLKNRRNEYEYQGLVRLADVVSTAIRTPDNLGQYCCYFLDMAHPDREIARAGLIR